MRPTILCICFLLSGCGRGEIVLSGTLAEGENLTHVWQLGSDQRAEIVGDSFTVSGITSDVVELRFARGANEAGGMELREIARGAHLQLRGIRVEDGVAFPAAVEGAADRVVVNGVRMGGVAALPDRVAIAGLLLSRSRSGDALLVRPDDDQLPDLRVVVTPATAVQGPGGGTASLERTDFGDSLRVTGVVEDGFLIATAVEIRAGSSAAGESSGSPTTSGGSANRSTSSSGTLSDAVQRAREAVEAVQENERERGQGQGRGPPPGRGQGRGN